MRSVPEYERRFAFNVDVQTVFCVLGNMDSAVFFFVSWRRLFKGGLPVRWFWLVRAVRLLLIFCF